jgi:hypothetical protein
MPNEGNDNDAMSDPRSTDPDMTQRHEVPAEPVRPPVIRTSGEAETYSPPPSEPRPDWARTDPEPVAARTPERWYEPAATVSAAPVHDTSVQAARPGRAPSSVPRCSPPCSPPAARSSR